MKDQGQFYQVVIVRVRGVETFRLVVKSFSTQAFDIHRYQRVDLR